MDDRDPERKIHREPICQYLQPRIVSPRHTVKRHSASRGCPPQNRPRTQYWRHPASGMLVKKYPGILFRSLRPLLPVEGLASSYCPQSSQIAKLSQDEISTVLKSDNLSPSPNEALLRGHRRLQRLPYLHNNTQSGRIPRSYSHQISSVITCKKARAHPHNFGILHRNTRAPFLDSIL